MRYASFNEFWPYYMSEHREAVSRALHFIGTGGFLTCTVIATARAPLAMGVVIALVVGIGWLSFGVGAKRAAYVPLLAMIALLCAGMGSLGLLAVVFAYGCAWVGHFFVEKNRPATFTYPLWSLAGDFRMFSHLVRGHGWSGDGSDLAGPLLTPEEWAGKRA